MEQVLVLHLARRNDANGMEFDYILLRFHGFSATNFDVNLFFLEHQPDGRRVHAMISHG